MLLSRIWQKVLGLQQNFLALGYVFLQFVFIALIGRLFGASTETDIFFLALTIVMYLGHLVQSVWEAWIPWYVERLKQDRAEADKIYALLLIWIALASFAIIVVYICVRLLWDMPEQSALLRFLDVFIIYLALSNWMSLNKKYLSLHEWFGVYYWVEIVALLIKIAGVMWMWQTPDVQLLAWIMVFAYSSVIAWQFVLIFGVLKARFSWVLRVPDDMAILSNSAKMKLGSLAYDLKEVLLAAVLTAAGPGIYSLYSYASKFTVGILEVVNSPIMNMFSTHVTHAHEEKRFHDIPVLVAGALKQTVVLFLGVTAVAYFAMPWIMQVFFGDKFTLDQMEDMRWLFLLLSGFTFIIVLESPYAHSVGLFRYYGFGMWLNILFGAIMMTGYGVLWLLDKQDQFMLFLAVLLIAQSSNYYFYWKRYRDHLRVKMLS
jgi:putative peptidoglycan lipid II flippase